MKTVFIFLIAAGAAAFLYFLSPQNSGFIMKCPFLEITGLYCPGCGSMRCCNSLLHGNFLNALDLNPLTVLSMPILLIAYIKFAIREFSGKRIQFAIVRPAYVWALVIFIFVFWITRNIPYYPLTLLAP